MFASVYSLLNRDQCDRESTRLFFFLFSFFPSPFYVALVRSPYSVEEVTVSIRPTLFRVGERLLHLFSLDFRVRRR